MEVPFQLTFRDYPHSDSLAEYVARRVERLEHVCDRIISCHVVLEEPHRSQQRGKQHVVRVDLIVPGAELVAGRAPGDSREHEDAYAAIDDAFDDADRQLLDYLQRARRDGKRHQSPPHAQVSKLFPELRYGFLATSDGREIYFHANSVLHGQFHRLRVGTPVRFAEEDGEKGPQASTVAISRRHLRPVPPALAMELEHEAPGE